MVQGTETIFDGPAQTQDPLEPGWDAFELVASSPDCVQMLDVSGHILRANEAARKRLELVEAKSFRNWVDLWSDDDQHAAERVLHQARGGTPGHFAGRSSTNGVEAWWDASISPVRKASGRVAGLLVIMRDISDRKHLEHALHDTEARCRAMFENLPVPAWEQDYSRVRARFEDLRKRGVTDLGAYLEQHPEELQQMAGLVRVLDVTNAAVDLLGADRDRQMHAGLGQFFSNTTWEFFRSSLASLFSGATRIEGEAETLTASGRKLKVIIRLAVSAGHEIRLNRVLMAYTDITERKQFEVDLKSNEERAQAHAADLEAVMAATPVSILVSHDAHCREVFGNAAAHELLGIPPGQNLAVHAQPTENPDFRILRAGESLPAEELPMCKAARTGVALQAPDLQVARKDGTRRSVFGYAAPLSKDGTANRGAVCVLLDITAREAAEKELRRTRDLLQAILNNAHVQVACLDSDLKYVLVNEGFAAAYGRRPEHFAGKCHLDFCPDKAHETALRQVLETGEPYLTQSELGIRSPEAHGTSNFWNWSVIPIKEKGQVTLLVVTFIDVTDRRRAELRMDLLATTAEGLLRTSEPQQVINQLCVKALDYLDCDAFFNFLVDEESGRLHLNTCGGIPPDEAKQIEWLDVGVAVCGYAIQGGRRIVAERIAECDDPRVRHVKRLGIQAYACNPLRVQDRILGTLSFGTRSRTAFSEDELGLMKTVSDMVAIALDRRRAETDLRRANAELETRVAERTRSLADLTDQLNGFCHSVAHDLRAPLRTQIALSRLLTEEYGDKLGAEGGQYARLIGQAAERQMDLVQDLMAHIAVGRADLPIGRVEVRGIVEAALADLSTDFHKTQANVDHEGVQQHCVLANAPSLHLALMNLLSNALKFVPSQSRPEIRLWTVSRAGLVRIWVQDNGIGIAPADLSRLFGLFQRVNTHARYPGTGLGLALVKKAAERMGGSVGVESEPGSGSRFWIELKEAV